MLKEIIRPYISLITDQGEPVPVKLAGDGSNRSFYRFSGPRGSLIIVVPQGDEPLYLRESEAYYYIGRHLASKGVPTPHIHGYDRRSGTIIMEDLGDTHLESVINKARNTREMERWYREAIEILVNMQISGAEGFDTRYCSDTPVYDRKLMLERESGYFVEAFLQGYLGLGITWSDLAPDLERLADLAGQPAAAFFLHRDFQSRNLLVCGGRLRLIDFQGGRLGPLAYDLASLLFDPYVDLPEHMKSALFEEYIFRLRARCRIDEEEFRHHFWYLALQRSLQVLGAFGFLSRVQKKVFFASYIPVAIKNLQTILSQEIFLTFGRLQEIVRHL